MSALAIKRVPHRAIMQLQKEFSKPFASKALTEYRKEPPGTLSSTGPKASICKTATEQQVSNPSRLIMDDICSSAFPLAASKKLLLEESLRMSTQSLNVGNLLVEKTRRTKLFVLQEDL